MDERDFTLRLKDDLNRLRSMDGYLYAGYPKFMGLFGRDSLISSWQLLDIDPDIAKYSLAALARLQGKEVGKTNGEEPGKILHEYYPQTTSVKWFKEYKAGVKWLKPNLPFYFSVDSTPLFLILLSRYYKETKDDTFFKEIWPHALRAVRWIIKNGISPEDPFLRYIKPKSKEDGLLSQSWKDGADNIFEKMASPIAVVEVQGYLYAALEAVSHLARENNENEISHDFKERAIKIRSEFEKAFWVEEKNFYALAIDGKNKKVNAITSNPGQLLFTGILSEQKAAAVVKRLFEKDMWTPYGIRTLSTEDEHFDATSYQNGSVWPHDNWIIAQGLKSMGHEDAYMRVRQALLKAYDELGASSEYYCVSKEGKLLKPPSGKSSPCAPQAWSAGAFVQLSMGD